MGESMGDDWYHSRPLGWALSPHLCSRKCALLLLKNGANPYLKDGHGLTTLERNIANDLGGSKAFVKRFNDICVQKSPPRPGGNWNELSIAARLHVIVTKWI